MDDDRDRTSIRLTADCWPNHIYYEESDNGTTFHGGAGMWLLALMQSR